MLQLQAVTHAFMGEVTDVVDSYAEKLPLAGESVGGSAIEVISEERGQGGHIAKELRAERGWREVLASMRDCKEAPPSHTHAQML